MDDIKIPDSDISKIQPFSKEYSSIIWERYISKGCRHLCLMDKNEWPFSLVPIHYNWIPDWNENNFSLLADELRDKTSFDDKDIILFFWMKECAVKTTWGIFLKYWVNFLFEDEGPILIRSEKKTAIRFSATGSVFIGERKSID